MRIHGVTIRNFKGLEVELPWPAAIVLFGPNDSGKTNVLEGLTSALSPGLELRLEPYLEGRDPDNDAATVELLVELDGLGIDGHRDQDVFLDWLLNNAEAWWSCPCASADAEVLAVEEDARWAELMNAYSRLQRVPQYREAVAQLVERVRIAAREIHRRRLDALPEEIRGQYELADEAFDSCWFVVEAGGLKWCQPGDSLARPLIGEFALYEQQGGIESFHAPLGIRMIRMQASEESLSVLYGRLEALLEALSVQDRSGVRHFGEGEYESRYVPVENDPWVELTDAGVSLRPVIVDRCQALSGRINDLAPPFISDSYNITVTPLRPDEWRACGDRRVAVRLRPHALDRDFDLSIAASGIAAWTISSISEAIRLAEDELADTAHPSQPALSRPGPTVFVFDEPEAHLHPLAQEQAATWIAERARAGAHVLLATHAVPFLRLPLEDVEYLRVTRSPVWETSIERITDDMLSVVAESAEALGLPPTALIQLTRAWLVVEGEHDLQMLDAFHGRELRRAGIQILVLRGANRAKGSFLALGALSRLRIPFFCLLDNTRAQAVKAGRIASPSMTEEEKIDEQLIRLAQDAGLDLEVYGLPFPDIICALPIDAVREVVREYGGDPSRATSWSDLIDQHQRSRREAGEHGSKAPPLKPYVLETLGLRGWNADRFVREVLRVANGEPSPASPLSRLVTEIVAAVSARSVAPVSPEE